MIIRKVYFTMDRLCLTLKIDPRKSRPTPHRTVVLSVGKCGGEVVVCAKNTAAWPFALFAANLRSYSRFAFSPIHDLAYFMIH